MASGQAKPAKKLKPQKFGRYLLLDRIASGGMAEVWRAKIFGAEDFQRIVAIKKILPHVAEDADFVTMFKDEAKITVLLQHASIGQVYELGKIDDTYFIAMEYVPGKDCKTIWQYQRQRKEPLPVPIACHVIQNVCEGLDYAHRKKDNFGVDLKIVHRDVSPQNILVSWEGEVKLIDFGIAKAAGKASRTQAGILKGKFGYMAPEQVRGLPIDQRADVFALGVCLYELLTGQRAFQADSDFSLLEMVRNVELTPPTIVNKNIPHDLEQIIYKALAKEPDDRFQWAAELSQALQRFLIMSGNPPTRLEVGQYLRENFTVDYDRERLRMEAYRDIEMPEEPAKVDLAAQKTRKVDVPPELDRGSAAVMAALEEDGGRKQIRPAGGSSDANDIFSSMIERVPARPAGGTDSGAGQAPRRGGSRAGVMRASPSAPTDPAVPAASSAPTAMMPTPRLETAGIRPALRPVPISERFDDPDRPSSLFKVLGISLGALVGTVLVGLGLYLFVLGKGTILITTQPCDVKVFLDGESVGSSANCSLSLPNIKAGTHDLAAQKEGYIPFSEKIVVSKNTTTNRVINLEKLPDQLGTLEISSTPAGAQIWIDGENSNQVTPSTIDVAAAVDHKIEIRRDNFAAFSQRITVDVNATERITATLRSRFVRRTIKSASDEATVIVNGKNRGKTPLILDNLDAQGPPLKIVLKAPGCETYETTLTLNEEEPEKDEILPLKCK
ncbi:MAG: protein kinase [Deltaproteobacteria bacterium]|nr:protein kinase [Deltaproteobacteria bacterium]